MKKIADSMATALGCEAIKVTTESKPQAFDLDNYDLVLVGTGLFCANTQRRYHAFLDGLTLKSQKHFALFLTWGGASHSDKIALGKLHAPLEGKGDQKVLDDNFADLRWLKGNSNETRTPKTRRDRSYL